MMWIEVQDFADELHSLEEFFYKLASFNHEYPYAGLKSVLRESGFTSVKNILENFSTTLLKCVDIAPFINRKVSEHLRVLLEETKLENHITHLSVRFKISENARHRRHNPIEGVLSVYLSGLDKLVRVLTNTGSAAFFSSQEIKLEEVITALSRLKVLIKRLADEYYQQTKNQEEIFTPSNLDVDLIAQKIELAIYEVTVNVKITPQEKSQLIAYLKEAKAGMASDNPPWKNIVGALMICAAVLSGVADAPQAIRNIDDALGFIMKGSVKTMTPSLQLPQSDRLKQDSADLMRA